MNLDPGVTKTARASRAWLMDQIHGFANKISDFPFLYSEKDIFFGSFARSTKIRELDDIDVMVCLGAYGAYYTEHGSLVQITVPPQSNVRLSGLCTDGTTTLNSRRVINKFVAAMKDVAQYEKADISRNQETATLKLKSYTWNFDIVPCFFTAPNVQGKTCYIIPDGAGHWKKTDPRQDRDLLAAINQRHEGRILDAIRVMKFWNKRQTAPAMPSYLLETMLISHYLNWPSMASSYVGIEIPSLLSHIAESVFNPVHDLKGIQGDLNSLSVQDRLKICMRAKLDYASAVEARSMENNGDQKASIKKWGEVFGPQFPCYTL